MIDLRLIGGFEVLTDDARAERPRLTQPKRLALLLYLALAEPAGLHSRDRLLALLWPDADDASSRHSLRNALHALRQALGDDAIVTRGEGWVGLEFSTFRCDVLDLRAHLAAGRVDEAIALASGELAPGFHLSGAPDLERWLEEQRRTLGRAVRAAAWKRARELEGAGAAELEAVRVAMQLDPGNEPGARHLMQLLDARGDRSAALRAYQDLADWLAHELETEPSAETRALAERLRAKPPGPAEVVSVGEANVIPIAAPALDRPVVLSAAKDPLLPSLPHNHASRGRVLALGLGVAVALGASAYLSRASIADNGAPHSTIAASAAMIDRDHAALRLPAKYRTDTGAYSSYMRGLTLRLQFNFKASRDTLAALVDRNPLYVPGLYGLAHAWIFMALDNSADPAEAWPRIETLARRAIALDSSAANAWLALASQDEFVHHDLQRAGERMLLARRLDPLDPEVAAMRSVWFRFQGEMDSSLAEVRLARRLDPFSLMHERLLAKQLYYARRYDESRDAYLRMLQDSPSRLRGYRDLAQVAVAMGRPREAVDWLRQAHAADGDSAGAAALASPATDIDATRLLATEARRTIAKLDTGVRAGQRVKSSAYAQAFAALRDTGATLRWLDSMRVNQDSYLFNVRVDPAFDFLRDLPAYRAWENASALPPMRAHQMVVPRRPQG